MLSFNVAYLSVMPLPEKALMSGNCCCNAGSKFDASTTSKSSTPPSALGSEITADVFRRFIPVTESNVCLNAATSKLNNLNSVGKLALKTALSFTIEVWFSLLGVQNFPDCEKAETVTKADKQVSSTIFLMVTFCVRSMVFMVCNRYDNGLV